MLRFSVLYLRARKDEEAGGAEKENLFYICCTVCAACWYTRCMVGVFPYGCCDRRWGLY